jgi:hypothetical protein
MAEFFFSNLTVSFQYFLVLFVVCSNINIRYTYFIFAKYKMASEVQDGGQNIEWFTGLQNGGDFLKGSKMVFRLLISEF